MTKLPLVKDTFTVKTLGCLLKQQIKIHGWCGKIEKCNNKNAL
jgi:hypothetical protein